MKTLYLECKMGAAGDMLMAALYELVEEKQEFLSTMETLFHPDIFLFPESAASCGVRGTHMHVQVYGTTEKPAVETLLETMPEDVQVIRSTPSHSSGHRHHESEHGHHRHSGEHHRHHHHHSTEHHHAQSPETPEDIFRETTDDSCSYEGILKRIDALALPEKVREDAAAVYRLIGEAEAAVHGCAIEQIHFHEVGSLDALADVVGCCLLFSYLKVDLILASPIHVGNGTVACTHGVLPVPAPATAELLKGIPFYTGNINSELCTPTGAALLKHFVHSFAPMPVMTVTHTGVGIGSKEFTVSNSLRAFFGETESEESDRILELSCNLDDMTGEELGYAMDILLEAGALDVFYESVHMKKNRPGILLHCLCVPEDKERFIALLFAHTTTRGLRFLEYDRAKLTASFEECNTPYGKVRRKVNTGYGVTRCKYEFEDLKRIAAEQGISLSQVRELLSSGH